MYKILLMVCLVTCTLGYGSVWAFDGHFDESMLHENSSNAMGQGDDDEDHSSCDHCCHASAHLTGLWANQPGISIPDRNSVWLPYLISYNSILTVPPGHPPQS
jgi:hypothetical protein